MKKLLIFLSLFVSTQSFGNWSLLSVSDELDLMIDKSTITTIKNNKRVWLLFNFKEIQKQSSSNVPYLSQGLYVEFSCIEKSYKFLQLTYYKKNLGNELIDISNTVGSESFVVPNSVFDSALKSVCKK
jgi:hypothetical protein